MISGLKMTYQDGVSDRVLQRRRVRLLTAWMRLFDSVAGQEGKMRHVNGPLAQQTALTCHSRGKKNKHVG